MNTKPHTVTTTTQQTNRPTNYHPTDKRNRFAALGRKPKLGPDQATHPLRHPPPTPGRAAKASLDYSLGA